MLSYPSLHEAPLALDGSEGNLHDIGGFLRGETGEVAQVDESCFARVMLLQFLYRFEYQATYEDRGSEHELCSVYAGRLPSSVPVVVDPKERCEKLEIVSVRKSADSRDMR